MHCLKKSKSRRYLPKAPEGCKFLRELHFNPQSQGTVINPVMPRVVAYILRRLKHLRICDIDSLADGIDYYLHGPQGGYHPKMNRLANLRLSHLQAPSNHAGLDDILQVMFVIPLNEIKVLN